MKKTKVIKKQPVKEKKQRKTTAKTEEKNVSVVCVYDTKGKEEKTIVLPKHITSAKINPQLIAQYMRVYHANQRQGTASTKTRSEVVGSTRKIYKQKGTGKARHGDIKAPIFVGGGIVGGPKPRDHSLLMNKKQKIKTIVSILGMKIKEKSVLAFSNAFETMEPKTKNIAYVLKTLHIEKDKILYVTADAKTDNHIRAAQNLKRVEMISIGSLNPFALLKNKTIIFQEKALEQFIIHYSPKE